MNGALPLNVSISHMTPTQDIRAAITDAIGRVFRDSAREIPPTHDDAVFGEQIKLDSLDFAVIVVQLEQTLGVDPFRSGARPVQTVGEFIKLYEDAVAKK
jgi:acyl carrier protein